MVSNVAVAFEKEMDFRVTSLRSKLAHFRIYLDWPGKETHPRIFLELNWREKHTLHAL